jgi:transcriptional regulator with XRE-family HTH domain
MHSQGNGDPQIEGMDGTIRRLRQLRALSQRELAQRAGLDTATINRIERGKQRPMPRTIRKLADALGVTTEEIMTDQPRLM